MPSTPVETPDFAARVIPVLKRFWGFDSLRPMQEEAIRAGCEKRDSLVVLPTGGGKSLCYQVPPILTGVPTIVVSPLISLMKDQVDGLRACGYPAAALHSGLPCEERRNVEAGIAQGRYALLLLSPERVATDEFARLVRQMKVNSFTIDEAHCISHWGHDFRPEYRQLSNLKDRFPGSSVHAFTATATPRVREDILSQLRLNKPAVLVGSFDRANLVYRVIPREDECQQVLDVIHRHPREALIVYCISRKDTERLADFLKSSKVRAEAYHAGLSPDLRRRIQDGFSREDLDVVVATVAFGMGIDRSNVRCVIHSALPKSIEHYQQETGRAGRDGLEAECVLLFGDGDVRRWQSLITKTVSEGNASPEVTETTLGLLREMGRYAHSSRCRHRFLVEYFGQTYGENSCAACDNCLRDSSDFFDGTIIAQKILSCVARVEQRFGIQHVVDVLLGEETEAIGRCNHHTLSTHGLMSGTPRKHLVDWVHQLADQDLVTRTTGERPILNLNERSWKILRGRERVRLRQVSSTIGPKRKSRADSKSWEGVNEALFEQLRTLRRRIADQRGVPAFVILSDATLRELARSLPKTRTELSEIRGFGERKLNDFGEQFLRLVVAHAGKSNRTRNAAAQIARAMFARGCGIGEVASALERSRGTATRYLVEYIETDRPERIDHWVDIASYDAVAEAARELGADRLKPIFERTEGKVPYDQIRLVMAHLSTRNNEGANVPHR